MRGRRSAQRGVRPVHRTSTRPRTRSNFPVLYTNAREGSASTECTCAARTCSRSSSDRRARAAAAGQPDAPLQILVANLDSSDYLGRIAIGRIFNGTVKLNDSIAVLHHDGAAEETKVTKLFAFDGLKRVEVEQAAAGDIVCLAGIEDITIGDTISDVEHRLAIPIIAVDEPTVSMIFGVNTSPMAGRDGQYVTSRNLRDRLQKELLGNVSVRVEDTESPEQMKVIGRGELQLSILIEMMRREGYEIQVSRPDIVTRKSTVEDGAGRGSGHRRAGGVPGRGHRAGGTRRGVLTKMVNHGSGRVRLEFRIPRAGLIGFRSQFLTDTKGTGIMNHLFAGWEPWHGAIPSRTTGRSWRTATGVATAFAIWNLQERGEIFIEPATPVYEG
jgi:GTP-binding protein